jgi:hypothetical protein
MFPVLRDIPEALRTYLLLAALGELHVWTPIATYRMRQFVVRQVPDRHSGATEYDVENKDGDDQNNDNNGENGQTDQRRRTKSARIWPEDKSLRVGEADDNDPMRSISESVKRVNRLETA